MKNINRNHYTEKDINSSLSNFYNNAICTDDDKKKLLKISNRRYLGSKTKILDFIYSVIESEISNINTIADIFAGTGVVSNMFYQLNKKVIVNDILESNYICYNAWFGKQKVNIDKLNIIINELNNLEPIDENYVSLHFANKYFDLYNAKKIGLIREKIETYKINKREKHILLTSLLYAIDKVANTTGHYDAFLKKEIATKKIELVLLDIKNDNNDNEIYCEDANKLVRKIKADLFYIDTPYNSRQYSSAYHLIENIITWKKPKVEGVASKMVTRKEKSSIYCIKKAKQAFDELISNINTKFNLVSFNNMEQKGNERSNSKISKEEIMKILEKKGEVFVYEIPYKYYSTGKSKIDNHKEILYFCKVNNESN